MCLFFSDEISHYPLNYSVKQGEMTAMTASPIGLYSEKRTRPTCVTSSPGRSDAIHFAPWESDAYCLAIKVAKTFLRFYFYKVHCDCFICNLAMMWNECVGSRL